METSVLLVRAYTYIRTMGPVGLREVSEGAVLHANYLRKKLEPYSVSPYSQICKHEFVLSGSKQKETGCQNIGYGKTSVRFRLPSTNYLLPIKC